MRLLPTARCLPPTACCLLLCVLAAVPVSGGQKFPYKAYITGDDVHVRSGPGSSYYPTDKLRAGQEVEIYRHDPGGWFAIRPTKGSYSWVSARYLKPAGEGLAEVTGERVAARVGSRFSKIRDVVQARLHRGETVELLQGERIGSDAGASGWCKIAPPSGEFRWVFGKYVDPEYPHGGVRKAPLGNNPLVQQAPIQQAPASPQEASPASQIDPAAATAGQPGEPSSAEVPTVQIPDPTDDPTQTDVRQSPSSTSQSAAEDGPKATPGDDVSFRRPAGRLISPEEFQAELADIDMELSIMIAEEVTVWEFKELDMLARSLLNQAETAIERGRARVLVNKINRFGDIKCRHDSVAAMRTDVQRRNGRLANLARVQETAVQGNPPASQFDGTGRLTRVVSSKVGSPRYALLDEQGRVRCYVTPSPGVNLRHYVGREVGVNGIRGIIPEKNTHHVMAKHVTVLNQPTMR